MPVVSYDRLIENGEVDAYVSFDNEKVGELQAETLAKKLKEDGSASGPIIMINGDPADPNAALFKEGAHKGFEAAGVEDRQGIRHARLVRRKRPARGAAGDHRARQQRLRRHLRRQRRHRRRRDRGDEGRRHQPRRKAGHRSGRDRRRPAADPRRPAVHDGLQGNRRRRPRSAAEIAIALAEGEEVPQDKVTEEINNGKTKVPSVLLEPIAVTKDNVKSTVVADGFVTASELCTGAYAAACKEAGISG